MLKNQEQTDIKVVVGNEAFECHMIVLKIYSDFFKKLGENQNNDTSTVILPDDKMTATAFRFIYDWMLSDENNVDRSCFAEVFKASKFLKIHELTGQLMCCIDDLKVIGEREALSIYLEAKDVNEKSLQDYMRNKISKIFLTFVSSWEYIELETDEVIEFFKSNRLGVNSELDMLFSAIRWLQHEWPQRKKSVQSILKLVRFELMQSWQLVELKKYPKELEHIFKISEIQEIIDNALHNISLQRPSHCDGDKEASLEVFNRRIVNDSMWNEFQFEKNPNFYQNYCNFCKYLSQLDSCHWRKIKYADVKHESVVLWSVIEWEGWKNETIWSFVFLPNVLTDTKIGITLAYL